MSDVADHIGEAAFHTELNIPHPYMNMRRKGRGVHIHRHRDHSGEGILGGVFNGAAGLSNLIGGHGSDEASKVLSGIGGVANAVGLGVAHKHNPVKKARKTKARQGKGFSSDVGQ